MNFTECSIKFHDKFYIVRQRTILLLRSPKHDDALCVHVILTKYETFLDKVLSHIRYPLHQIHFSISLSQQFSSYHARIFIIFTFLLYPLNTQLLSTHE